MNPVEAVSLSGLRYASATLAAHASNTVNLLSEGYHAREVSGVTADGGGVRPVVSEDETAPATTWEVGADGTLEARELSNVSLEDEMIGARLAVFLYAANGAVIYHADAAAGSLLNRMA